MSRFLSHRISENHSVDRPTGAMNGYWLEQFDELSVTLPCTISLIEKSIEVVRDNMKIFRLIIAVIVGVPLLFIAWVIYISHNLSSQACENVREISRSEKYRDYLSNWVLESFGPADSANEIPEPLVPKSLDWSRFNIDPSFASLKVELTTINLDNATEKAYLAYFRDGRAEVMFLVPDHPVSNKMVLHQAVPQVYKEISTGVWIFCEERKH